MGLITDDGESDESVIKLYTLFLLLPQVTYFMIFTLIFYSWFCLVHFLFLPDMNTSKKKKNIKFVLYFINLFLWIFLLIYYVSVFQVGYPSNNDIFIVGAIIWAILLTA